MHKLQRAPLRQGAVRMFFITIIPGVQSHYYYYYSWCVNTHYYYYYYYYEEYYYSWLEQC